MANVDTRQTILNVASNLFAARGYEAISMRDVALETKITTASLYYHFADKEELIRKTLAYVFAEKTEPLEVVLHRGSSPQERFELFIAWFVHLIFEDPIFSRLMARELLDSNSERIEYMCKTVFDKPFALMTRTIAEYSARSEPALSTLSVISVILGHYQFSRALTHLPGCRADYGTPERLVRHFTELFRLGFKAE